MVTMENSLYTLSDFLMDENSCVIFDTNIYLNLYEFSPETTEFFVRLCNYIKGQLYLPSTVKREFENNHQTSLNRQRNKFQNAVSNLINPVNQMQDKLIRQFEILNSFNYPGIDDLEESVSNIVGTLRTTLDSYIDSHQEFEEINRDFLDRDIVNELILEIIDEDQLLDAFTLEEIYQLCIEGERRYKNNIPPGYKDGEKKKGINAFGDFLIWKEALNFCSINKKNLIFVTDDVKEDWYKIERSTRVGFREELIQEFSRITSFNVIGVTSSELFSELANINGEEIPSTAEWIIGYDLENYLEDIKNSDIYSDIEGLIMYTLEEYIDTSSLSSYDGTNLEYEEDSFTIEFIEGAFEGYENGTAEYTLKFNIKAKCYSNEYYGRDMDTKEIIFSPTRIHDILGDFDIRLTRGIDSYLDYWAGSNLYDEIDVVQGLFVEESMVRTEDLCIECGKREGIYVNYYQDPICEKCMVINGEGEICTFCGTKTPAEFMYDHNKCLRCSEEYDD